MNNNKRKIVDIDINKLHPHEDNPRKNVGDVSELAESIKKEGVLQNLTVVPATGYYDGDYTVVIGHRRLAAAKEAGLTELPCIISDMSPDEQLMIMLTENIQRRDLTPMEEGEGFQRVIDCGYSVADIAEKTGFSKTTVYHRLNIAKLDKKAVKTFEENNGGYQVTLDVYTALEKVESVAKRNEILKSAYSVRDVQAKASQAERDHKRNEAAKEVIKKLKAMDITEAPKGAEKQIYYVGIWDTLKEIDLDKEIPEKITIKHKNEDKLYYFRTWNSILIIRKAKKEKKTETPEEKKNKERQKRIKTLKAKVKEMNLRGRDFVIDICDGKIDSLPAKESEAVKDEIWAIIFNKGSHFYRDDVSSYIFEGKIYWDCTEGEREAAEEKMKKVSVVNQMLASMCYQIKDTIEICDYYGKMRKDTADKLKRVYAIFERYGWTFTEEERSLLDGTHELFIKPEEAA